MADGESPIFAFQTQPSLLDFSGHLAGLFFLSGCNFRCGFCHNAGLLAAHSKGMPWSRVEAACREFSANWVDGAVITGGEPTLLEGLPDLIAWFRNRNWAVKLDTNGSNPDRLRACLPRVDYVAMDIKTGLSGYESLTGWTDGEAIRASVCAIRDQARDYEFRTTILPGEHTESMLREMGELLRGARRWILQPFIPRDDLPDVRFRSLARTHPDALEAARCVAAEYVAHVSVRG